MFDDIVYCCTLLRINNSIEFHFGIVRQGLMRLPISQGLAWAIKHKEDVSLVSNSKHKVKVNCNASMHLAIELTANHDIHFLDVDRNYSGQNQLPNFHIDFFSII